MILGIGSDLCDIRRIEETLAKFGDRFGHEYLGPGIGHGPWPYRL